MLASYQEVLGLNGLAYGKEVGSMWLLDETLDAVRHLYIMYILYLFVYLLFIIITIIINLDHCLLMSVLTRENVLNFIVETIKNDLILS